MLITDQKLLSSLDKRIANGEVRILRAVMRDNQAVWVVDLPAVSGLCFVKMSDRYAWSRWVGQPKRKHCQKTLIFRSTSLQGIDN